MEFWAKTTIDGHPGISVMEHMLNTGRVAQIMAERCLPFLKSSNLEPADIGGFAALHDIGKLSPGFQRKCEKWLELNNLLRIDRNYGWDASMEADHGKVTHAAVQSALVEQGMARASAKYVGAILGAHHGKVKHCPDDRGWRLPGISESASGIDWDLERKKSVKDVLRSFGLEADKLSIGGDNPFLWWLAGLTSVADWIASDERFFLPSGGLDEGTRLDRAKDALASLGFIPLSPMQGLSFQDLFRFPPNEMQLRVEKAVSGPGVHVVEAPMGMGKTEAALWAAYKLICDGKAGGIYFALPTQATSNRIHIRMEDFVRKMLGGPSKVRLIHGSSWLKDDVGPLVHASGSSISSREGDARDGRDWFASLKRALLAPFGVGTLDQALLGVVAAKHFFIRRFALAGKVVIIDEVHSYDIYTGTLIDKLVKELEGLACTVIILSATLSGRRRAQFVSGAMDESLPAAELAYPLISSRTSSGGHMQQEATPPQSKKVEICFLSVSKAQEEAVAMAAGGGVVLWICDTVESAQAQFRKFKPLAEGRFKLGLLHSRFTFLRRESLEDEWMERLGKEGASRCGCILVSTQIVEQSVDLDADLMVSELAPTDMLLQRLGRLWRHGRPSRPAKHPRLIILEEDADLDAMRSMSPEGIKSAFGGKAWVYSPYVLLRTLELWHGLGGLELPGRIRPLIEATYAERDGEPAAWRGLFDEMEGKAAAHRGLAFQNSNEWAPPLDDIEGVQTRLDENPQATLLLCRSLDKAFAVLLDGTECLLGGEDFSLPTAKAVHRNAVHVPVKHLGAGVFGSCGAFESYLRGQSAVGVVQDGGHVAVAGLNPGVELIWSDELGLLMEKQTARSRS